MTSKMIAGVPDNMRENSKIIQESMSVQLLKNDDGSYNLNSTMLIVTELEQNFRLDEEKDITTPDGRKVKSSFTIDGNVLTERQIGEKHFVIIREFFEDEMITTLKVGNVVSKSWLKRVK